VVLSTNIAEASITIDDVSTVVDCGTHKEMQYDPYTSMAALVQARISRANAAQRAVRAGRVRAGVCYHLFLLWEEANVMLPQQLPEIQRSPLEMTCLRIKMLGLGSIAAALAQAPEPPGAAAVDHVLRVLSGLGLTRQLGSSHADSEPEPEQESVSELSSEVEALTPMGSAVASLPVDPRIGKLVLLGAVFQCLEPTLILAASLATRSPFVSPFAKRDEASQAKRGIDDWSGASYLSRITFYSPLLFTI
jgi:ATP-dependent RNA helicase DHX36